MLMAFSSSFSLQNMEKAFKAMGYATQVQSLSHFYDDYGLQGDDEDDGKDDPEGDDEEEDDEGSSEDDEDDMSEEEDALMDGADDLDLEMED